ncbi:class I SAM-dependent methyltransferase [Roseomonas sp. BN140053]|uniref:class I SAM-dependent methyltransferase n=1 Tax=Roseomonas sp. BN140053 TaxID=3391898 RepID=UPI0039E99A7E
MAPGAAPDAGPALPPRATAEAERLDHFMARAVAAYYAGRDPFGAGGDFTTAPEISQVFGECLGLWAAVTWQLMGSPDPVLLAELGPGRGTLMADATRAIREVMPGFARAARLHLVETSPALRAAQRARLPDATWHDAPEALPDGPLILLANEFLDALPIRQFQRQDGLWRERWVRNGAFLLRDAADPPTADAPDGTVRERSDAALAIVSRLAARLAAQGGAALFLDYGSAEGGAGDSLQAVRAHGAADPLAAPGTADLTAHVDFLALAEAARAAGAAAHGPLPQGIFLRRLGLTQRAAVLAAVDPRRAAEHLAAAQRLHAPEAMGLLFKALALCHPALPTPPGFEAA